MQLNQKHQERINELFEKFQKGEGFMFPFSETAFPGINIYFNKQPKHILFSLEKIGDIEVCLGADNDEEIDDLEIFES